MAAPDELKGFLNDWGKQLEVDRSKKTITAARAVDFLMANLNGLRTAGFLSDAEGYDASYTWTETVQWFTAHGYPDEAAIVDNINGGGGWEVWPLTITGI